MRGESERGRRTYRALNVGIVRRNGGLREKRRRLGEEIGGRRRGFWWRGEGDGGGFVMLGFGDGDGDGDGVGGWA
tara:strand:+ start:842 stop:1066 length:225 start_codon:yes stop_codon:yes gene_type:complete